MSRGCFLGFQSLNRKVSGDVDTGVRGFVRSDGEREYRVGHELVDEFLEFVSGRARPSTVRAYAHDLKTFFGVVRKDPVEVTPADVLAFVVAQNRPRNGVGNVVRISDGRSGLSASTIKRLLAAVSSLYGYLVARGDVGVASNPVPRGLPTRKSRHRGGRAAVGSWCAPVAEDLGSRRGRSVDGGVAHEPGPGDVSAGECERCCCGKPLVAAPRENVQG